MSESNSDNAPCNLGIGSLRGLRTEPAKEFADWGRDTSTSQPPVARKDSPFASEHEYRLCKAIIEHPMQASSQYAKLAGMSPKTVQAVRTKLVATGFIREHVVNSGRRGPPTLLLEPLDASKEAVRKHELQSE
jgi:hypothetical protein